MVSLSPQVREEESALVGQEGSNLEQEVSTLLEQIEMMINALFSKRELAGVHIEAIQSLSPNCYSHWLGIIASWPYDTSSISEERHDLLAREALGRLIKCAIRNNLEKEARS